MKCETFRDISKPDQTPTNSWYVVYRGIRISGYRSRDKPKEQGWVLRVESNDFRLVKDGISLDSVSQLAYKQKAGAGF